HLLDRRGRPALPGAAGELWIAGAGVADGYLDAPGETAARFVTGPDGERRYRTGDLARWRGSVLEYLGRNDQQVKIRGHRVEPAETEAVLRGHPGLADAVVTAAGPPDGRYLVGHVVPGPDGVRPAAVFETYLRDRLPEHLVPRRWSVLDALPTTASGKTDRAALPDPGPGPAGTAAEPMPAMRRLVARVWAEVLRVERVGPAGDFFALGGDSLAATRVVGRLREALGHRIAVRALFDRPVLGDFADDLERTLLRELAAEAGGEAS
ncbi:phosphopantetheine-binding protein, partial [Streptomyces ziwulingensis]|uniref:phosphopantetheine-binding protein n=1 Tax=Streptomyces ziwulingensis TaxID=1045501 RepID=UPI0031F06D9C